jgi:ribose/xylose/arabinose/galactoside ABC-type transport system permease subunit
MTPEPQLRATRTLDTDRTDQQPSAERATQTTIVKSIALSVPLAVGIFVGLVALAVHNQQPDWQAWLAKAAGVGIVAGVFFGLLTGFMLSSDRFHD